MEYVHTLIATGKKKTDSLPESHKARAIPNIGKAAIRNKMEAPITSKQRFMARPSSNNVKEPHMERDTP